nr:hypothetical protein [Tanacetum cinerariifolium]
GNDEDDNNDDNDLKNEGSDEENKSDDDKTPFDNEKDLDSEQDTDGSESDSESDQQEYEEEVKDDDDDDDKFEDRVIALEQDVAKLKKDPLHTQVTALVDDHLDIMMGATREKFMKFLSESLTDRITKQVRNQLPQILPENRQRVPVEFFINNELKYLQGGILTITYMTSTTKTKATQYALLGIEDMVPNIWSPVKVDALQRTVQVQLWQVNQASFFAQRNYQEYRHRVLAEEKIEHIGKEKSLFYDLGHQQAAKGKKDDEELGEICYQNQMDLPRDIPLDSVVVLRYEKRSKSDNKGKVPTEMELVMEQTQQGTGCEVLVNIEGVEESKRKVKIKGEKKEALLTLRQKS